VRIESNVELARAALGRCAWGRVKILIPRNAWRGWIRTTETRSATATAGSGQQLGCHVNGFAGRCVRDDYQCVLLGAVTQGTNIGDLRVAAAGRLVISRLRTIGGRAICRAAIAAGIFVDVEIIVRRAAAGIGPAQRDFHRGSRMRGGVTRRERHGQRVIIAWLR
jgi:hypothetical protein